MMIGEFLQYNKKAGFLIRPLCHILHSNNSKFSPDAAPQIYAYQPHTV